VSELPQGWAETTVGEVAEVRLGKMLDQAKNKGEPTPYLRNTNVRWGEFDLSDVAEMRMTVADREAFKIRAGDVMVCEGGEPGRAAVWRGQEGVYGFQKALMRLRPLGGILPEWFSYSLKNATNSGALAERFTGTTIKHLPQVALVGTKLLFPPSAEQHRIVAKLDRLVARMSRARADLDRIPILIANHKRALLSAAFAGELTGDWRRTKRLPEWQSTTIERVASAIFDGPFGSNLKSSDYVASGVRVIRLENIGHLKFIGDKEAFVSPEKFESLRRHSLAAGDVLFSSFISEEIRVCLFPGERFSPAINKADCFCVRVNPAICDPRFLAFRLAAEATFLELKNAVHGATRPRISLKQLRTYSFDIASRPEQREIVRRIDAAFAWLDTIATEHSRAAHLLPKLQQSILAKALRGELVPQDPGDEPASALLDRIRAERQARQGDKARSASNPSREQGRKASPMRSTSMSNPMEQIRADISNWPPEGLTFEEVRQRVTGDYDSVQRALFELLDGASPVLSQEFDRDSRVMRIRKSNQ
jgi:type I restriction enzyme S subunit